MLINYLTIAWRNLIRHKGFSLINIAGLAVGMACCMVVSLFISDELSYDKQNINAASVYRIVENIPADDGSNMGVAATPPALATAISTSIPEIECVARLFPKPWSNNFYVRYGEKKFPEENIFHADPSVFKVFSFSFISGNPKTALANPGSIVLTESVARKYFGYENPVGKHLEIDDWAPCTVTAVVKDIPANMHFSFDMLVPLSRFLNESSRPSNTLWSWNSFYTYVRLKPGTNAQLTDKKIRSVYQQHQPDGKNYFYSQPVTSIHLHSNLRAELKPGSDIAYSWIFGTIAVFVLLIACINYINLTTARFSLRSKEIGIRKVSGATEPALISQFLTESMLLAFIAALIALVMAKLALPEINTTTHKQLVLQLTGNYFVALVFCTAIIAGLIAGFYPAVYLSSLKAVRILKGGHSAARGNSGLRKILVIAQFSISIVMITGSIIVIRQVDFMQRGKHGLDKENVLIVNDVAYLDASEKTILKNELLQVHGVKNVSAADGVLGDVNWSRNIRLKGATANQPVNFLSVDENFADVLNIHIKAGRNFYPNAATDTSTEVILNETAARQLGVTEGFTGRQIIWREDQNTGQQYYASIVGIVNDFQFASMKSEIKPFVFVVNNKRQWNYAIKIDGVNIGQTVAALKIVWDKNIKSRPFQYTFLDETFAKLYASEMSFKAVFSFFTFIAIFVASLGLLGLSAFVTGQRTKETAIRKILGASVTRIATMLSADFIKLLLIASFISFPIAWWVMDLWLRNFAYRINISWWIFLLATLISLLIALITISFHAVRTALANPVKSLRIE